MRLVLLLFIATALANIDISLDSNWLKAPFSLHLIESIASENNSLYVPTLSKIIGFEVSGQDEPVDDKDRSDEEMYVSAVKELDPTLKAYVDFRLANKYYSPKLQSHYQYYNSVVKPYYGSRLIKECSVDSFGTKIIKDGADQPDAWLIYKDKIYCSPDEVYALQTASTNADIKLLPFDRVIGESGPIMVLYGDINSDLFKNFFRNLYSSAERGKLRFVWRYLPDRNAALPEKLSGYGVDLTLKRTDYIVIDDRDIDTGIDGQPKSKGKGSSFWESYSTDIEAISEQDIKDLDIKAASYILDKKYDLSEFDMLNILLQDFPKYASAIKDQKINEKVKANAQANEDIGLNEESNGIYINGSPINRLELDIFKLINKIKSEKATIDQLRELGFTSEKAKELIQKFALLTAVKNQQSVFSRYDLYKDENIVFFNDLETDEAYSQYPTDREEYLQNVKPGQIPFVKENIHDIIFAINLSDRDQLKVFFHFTKLILDRGIPQQVGLIPLIDNELDELYAKTFLYYTEIEDPKEGLTYLFQLLAGEQPAVKVKESYKFKHDVKSVATKYSIKTPSVIFNGVFYDLSSQWQMALGRQLQNDIMYLQYYIGSGITGTDIKLKDLLFREAKHSRNLRIIPDDASSYTFKMINKELIDNSITLRKQGSAVSKDEIYGGTFWLVGDLSQKHVIGQLVDLLSVLRERDNIQLRILSTIDSPLIEALKDKNGLVTNYEISKLIFASEEYLEEADKQSSINHGVFKLLEDSRLPHNSFVLFNSRYFRIGEILSQEDLRLLIDHEFKCRLETFDQIFDNFNFDSNTDRTNEDYLSWFDLMSSIVTKSFYVEETMFVTDVARFDFSKLNKGNSIEVIPEDPSKEVDLLVVIDPIDEYSQKLVSIINSIREIPFINIRIVLQPKSEISEIGIKRFYRGVYPSKVQFNADGSLNDDYKGLFTLVPEETLFTLDFDVPSAWSVMIKDSISDLDNIKLINSGPVKGVYELKNILVEGFAKDIHDIAPPTGASIELCSIGESLECSDTRVMSNLGYLQLKANPGLFDFKLKTNTRTSEIYSLLSADTNPFSVNLDSVESVQLGIFNLEGLVIKPRITKIAGKEGQSLIVPNDEASSKPQSFLSRLYKPKSRHADINIFTVASGHLYERFLSIMTASVMKHTKHTVKFWLIENYMSSSFKKLLPLLSKKYGFEYELVTYKWPSWLRAQREKQRTIWGYKILFLDVLFPQDLEKVIFVDADQIVRTDMKELVDLNLEGAPYGYTPMGDSRIEMEGFRFWKQGYWEKLLGKDLKYHISALYVIDLKRFRDITAGDKLRHHYQRLSADPNSLSNLDQDLPNNLQRHIKIHSLPQEWLWCETWCSDESLKTAKTIDLCNNPLTKEPKLDRARRQIPEWTTYDNEIAALVEEAKQKAKVEELKAQETVSVNPNEDDSGFEEIGGEDYGHDEL